MIRNKKEGSKPCGLVGEQCFKIKQQVQRSGGKSMINRDGKNKRQSSSRRWNQRNCRKSDYIGLFQPFVGLWILHLIRWKIIRKFWAEDWYFSTSSLKNDCATFCCHAEKRPLESQGRWAVAWKAIRKYILEGLSKCTYLLKALSNRVYTKTVINAFLMHYFIEKHKSLTILPK